MLRRINFLIKFAFCFFCCFLSNVQCFASEYDLDEALRGAYTACVGIDDKLSDLKKMAGINTAITGVGTATSGGALVVGLIKSAKDRAAENIEVKLDELRAIEERNPLLGSTDMEYEAFDREFESSYASAVEEITKMRAELDKLNKQSKRLGNWRTGLMATGAATNIAGAVIAGKNMSNKELDEQIAECVVAIDGLKRARAVANMSGISDSYVDEVINMCGEYETVDVSKITKRAKGAMISSAVGATSGVAGTVTSAMANTDKIRDDNTDAGKKKEKGLNTASNVLAGVSTAASATATVFNAIQISAIKKVATVAAQCEGVLK